MANRNRDAGRENAWRETLRRQARSGLSVREFCRREKLGESNFYAWRRTIAKRGQRETSGRERHRPATTGGRNKKTSRPRSEPAFVPVAVKGHFEGDGGIVLELGGGRRLQFSESIEPERLAAFVRALEVEAVS